MQTRCLFSDQLQWHRELDMASMVRWLCAKSDAEGGCRRRPAPPHHLECLELYGQEKRGRAEAAPVRQRRTQREIFGEVGETDDCLAKERLRTNDVIDTKKSRLIDILRVNKVDCSGSALNDIMTLRLTLEQQKHHARALLVPYRQQQIQSLADSIILHDPSSHSPCKTTSTPTSPS